MVLFRVALRNRIDGIKTPGQFVTGRGSSFNYRKTSYFVRFSSFRHACAVGSVSRPVRSRKAAKAVR